MDPLSIAASTIALATLATKASKTIYEFTTGTRDVDVNVQNLYQGLRSLSRVLTSVSTAWTENPLVAVAHTGPDGNLWICVKDSVGNCEIVLKKLEAVLDKVSAENGAGKGFMRKPVKQVRLNLNKKDIEGFGGEVQAYERALSIAFNAINACAAIRRESTDAEVTKRLGTIDTGIQELLQSLQQRQSSSISYTVEATKTFEQFVRAADTFKSSAGTIVTDDASTVRELFTSQYDVSIFGESLSVDRYEIIQSWIPPAVPLGNHQHSLPELLALLGKATQMADQYKNSEEESNSNKDAQLRYLEMENQELQRQLEEAQRQASAKQIESLEYISRLQSLRTIKSEINVELKHEDAHLSDEEKLSERPDDEAARLAEELKNCEVQAKALTGKLITSQDENSAMRTRIGDLTDELKSNDDKYTLAVLDNTMCKDKIKHLERELDNNRNGKYRLQDDVAREAVGATNLEKANSQLSAESVDNKARIARLQKAREKRNCKREQEQAKAEKAAIDRQLLKDPWEYTIRPGLLTAALVATLQGLVLVYVIWGVLQALPGNGALALHVRASSSSRRYINRLPRSISRLGINTSLPASTQCFREVDTRSIKQTYSLDFLFSFISIPAPQLDHHLEPAAVGLSTSELDSAVQFLSSMGIQDQIPLRLSGNPFHALHETHVYSDSPFRPMPSHPLPSRDLVSTQKHPQGKTKTHAQILLFQRKSFFSSCHGAVQASGSIENNTRRAQHTLLI
ncbi:hypothetical protein VTL71DRAFT_11510 [Oculimacula yallundae]|uniref:Azaphilone pigments biosynthesis cluster protein L N-terminal domain-containing protein n=1 Tax=Oculimacula yallundae TaxID=86028 RepID=A0ABR4CRG8_9HELO